MNASIVKIQTQDGSIQVRKYDDVQTFIKDDYAYGAGTSSQYSSAYGPKPNYFTFKAGIYSPQSNDLDGFDTGFNGEIAFGHYFNKNVAAEFGTGYFYTEGDFAGINPIYGRYSETDKIKVIPLTLSIKGIIPFERAEFYAFAGVGLYFVRGEADVQFSSFSASIDDDVVAFGPHIGIGANINITEDVFIGLEGKYIWAEAEFAKYGYTLDVRIDGYFVNGCLGFRF
jgi:outer membrane protein W